MLHGPHNNKLMFLKTAGVYCEIWALHIARIMTFPKGQVEQAEQVDSALLISRRWTCVFWVLGWCECCYFSKLQKHGILS